ncbi:T9SS type A sorting domain-containing protein [Aquirufa novilacunae]|uniref:T9SS type A sorting domain-containing protein n=1 Tax=Aquirufa novilacunae TaxID=3139305 RepID=A0ABW8U710_9BACT
MKKLLLLLLLICSASYAQKGRYKMEMVPGKMIEEYTPEYLGLKRDLPAGYTESMRAILAEAAAIKVQSSTQTKASANIVVTYETVPPADVKAVFEKAAATWSTVFSSDVPIHVNVKWASLSANVLGSAGASVNVRNFVGANRLNTFYPIALAEKMAHKNLNGTNPDIVATFNSDFTAWYIGTDGVPTINQIDLYSVVLHEMGHGLGFIGQVSVDNGEAGYSYPGIFDQAMVNAANVALMDTNSFKNPSAALYTQVTSGKINLSTPSVLRNNGSAGKLYTPSTYSEGSSIYHVDQVKYKVGDENALMTPQIARGEITRSIGPIVTSAFNDFGWYSSNLIGEEYIDTEDQANDKVFSVKVYSDTLWEESSLKLYLAINSNTFNPVSTFTKSGNTYSYTLPKNAIARNIKYYWYAEEKSGKKFVTPAEAPVISGTRFGSFFEFNIAPDTTKPEVVYSNPLKYIFSSQTSVPLPTLLAADNIGIDTVYMEYSINSGAAVRKGFTKVPGLSFSYTNSFEFASGLLKAGDVVKYRIIVKDKAKTTNTVTLPATGTYDFTVIGLQAVAANYKQNFDTPPTADFYLKGFSFAQPSGFSSIGLHSAHPYADGSEESYNGAGGSDKFTNSDAILLKPITVRADTARIYFDEVVLVEPGEAGASFLNQDGSVNRSFYDYVIVQASNDNGKNWYNLINGWDSNFSTTWLNAYNTGFDAAGNSSGVGTSTLFKKREIDILSSGKFKAGDQLVFRFRLHADVGAHGWGWAIDNLNIQGSVAPPPPPLVLATEPMSLVPELQVSPNPTSRVVRVQLGLASPNEEVRLGILGLQGQWVQQETLQVKGSFLDKQMDISTLPAGTYFVQVLTNRNVYNKRIIVVR